jgi:ABC-type branched-subunit amino acid transport system substrate-binding protein
MIRPVLANIRNLFLVSLLGLIFVAMAGEVSMAMAASNDQPGFDAADTNRLGERMYRDGLLPDGTPMIGYVKGDVKVDSSMFSCANCHTRSGLGSVEGQITSPPVNGTSLFNPRYVYKDYIKNTISKSKGVTRPAKPVRPAYTDVTLEEAILGGVNPDGRELSHIMPRYNIEERDLRILVSYLKGLSSSYSPGVSDTTLKFATIITDDVSQADRDAMMGILDTLVKINQQTREQRKLPQFYKMFRMLDNAYFRFISITPWELKGAPQTWRSQLEEYYRKEPVFAVLGGISGKSWQPMHDFCEDNQIPCLFPLTDLPVISGSSWYTLYASKGYYQEGETAARYIAGSSPQRKVLQIVSSSPEGEALAAGFESTWKEVGSVGLETVKVLPGQVLASDRLKALLQNHSPGTVVFWGGAEVLDSFKVLVENGPVPDIYLSSRYVGKSIGSIPEELRSKVYIAFPYRLPEDDKKYAGYADLLKLGNKATKDDKRISSRTYSMVHIFLEGLKELRLDFYRDTLLDVIAMQPDQYLPDFERYSFGPGQRYASKGCYIVQLGKGAEPNLIRKSDWVVY